MIVAIIPAKEESSRLANKNMIEIHRSPMLDYSIHQARISKKLHRIAVSTDSEAIAAHARSHGVEIVMRSTTLGGNVPVLDVYLHALSVMGLSPAETVVCGLQPDHPDRTVSIDEALKRFEADQCDRLMSREADGTKNGAHYILSPGFLTTGKSKKDTVIIDDCTNIHFQEDLERAIARMSPLPAPPWDQE